MSAVKDAKDRLDSLIGKARVDMYKPIQIAEVLRQSRLKGEIDINELDSFRNPSLRWRDEVTRRLLGKVSTSSARYQHDVWNETAMPLSLLKVLDQENKRTEGDVERYIYLRFNERQETVSGMIAFIEQATSKTFSLDALLDKFTKQAGIKRSVDKAYEIIAYSLFETVVSALKATIKVSVPASSQKLLGEFSDLARVLLGVDANKPSWEADAHIYRVGVTNAADRGLDMWANFGPAIQVKHLTLDDTLAQSIIDQVESDHIVIVCRDVDAKVIEVVAKQINWGRRVRGIVSESELIVWYERCLRGDNSALLAKPLLKKLSDGFKAEFPQAGAMVAFLEERGYLSANPDKVCAL
jgi:type II restriction enzyme